MDFLTNINLSGNELQNAVIQPLATAPPNPKYGQIYTDSVTGKIKQYNGSMWVTIGYDESILNADGIIKQEHLPSGYPYSEVAEIVPDTEVVIDPSAGGMGAIVDQFALVVGGEYTVTWNGTEYACTGQEYSMEGVPCVAVGNVNALAGETPTDEPFAILNFDPDTAAGLGAYGAVFAFDGSTSATIFINGTLITKIDAAYIPDLGGTTNLVNGTREDTIRSTNSAPEEIGGDYMMGLGAIAMGYGTKASGRHSHAEGANTEASGNYSHAEGSKTTASATNSHAEGYNTTASGKYSHAEGGGATASGDYSHAEGSRTTASGRFSHAEGDNTIASGQYSHAEGSRTTASGDYSHAEGYYTKASSDYQHVQGQYNVEDTAGTYAHIVGNGEDNDHRSNAHTVDWDGNAWYQGEIRVGGTGYDDATRLATMSDLEDVGEVGEIPAATTETLGGIIVGENLTITEDGVLSAITGGGGGISEIPIATTDVLGGIIVGDNLAITESGVLSVLTANAAEADNTKPITAAAVQTELGNISALLATI